MKKKTNRLFYFPGFFLDAFSANRVFDFAETLNFSSEFWVFSFGYWGFFLFLFLDNFKKSQLTPQKLTHFNRFFCHYLGQFLLLSFQNLPKPRFFARVLRYFHEAWVFFRSWGSWGFFNGSQKAWLRQTNLFKTKSTHDTCHLTCSLLQYIYFYVSIKKLEKLKDFAKYVNYLLRVLSSLYFWSGQIME